MVLRCARLATARARTARGRPRRASGSRARNRVARCAGEGSFFKFVVAGAIAGTAGALSRRRALLRRGAMRNSPRARRRSACRALRDVSARHNQGECCARLCTSALRSCCSRAVVHTRRFRFFFFFFFPFFCFLWWAFAGEAERAAPQTHVQAVRPNGEFINLRQSIPLIWASSGGLRGFFRGITAVMGGAAPGAWRSARRARCTVRSLATRDVVVCSTRSVL